MIKVVEVVNENFPAVNQFSFMPENKAVSFIVKYKKPITFATYFTRRNKMQKKGCNNFFIIK